jgi:protoporphyrin/coproporphyrin ferrochelatase
MIGVLLMAHGTPESLDEMPEYLRLVRGGRVPSAELVEEMRHNYAAIGGRSPLTEISQAQGRALQGLLDDKGIPSLVVVGMRNWKPFIADAIRTLINAGVSRIVGIPLAPQFSSLSVQKYVAAAEAALPPGVPFACIRSFHDHPGLIEAFAGRLREAAPQPDEAIVFTAHSLPVRVVDAGDPYAREVAATASAIARMCGLQHYEQAWQSAGRTPEPWLSPDLSDFIRERIIEGISAFLVVPIGFVCDHTEILFDIDVQAATVARDLGVSLRRTPSLNTASTFIRALGDLVTRELARA